MRKKYKHKLNKKNEKQIKKYYMYILSKTTKFNYVKFNINEEKTTHIHKIKKYEI